MDLFSQTIATLKSVKLLSTCPNFSSQVVARWVVTQKARMFKAAKTRWMEKYGRDLGTGGRSIVVVVNMGKGKFMAGRVVRITERNMLCVAGGDYFSNADALTEENILNHALNRSGKWARTEHLFERIVKTIVMYEDIKSEKRPKGPVAARRRSLP